MDVKHDQVNRKTKLITLPITPGSNIRVGDSITLANLQEEEIHPDIKDADACDDPIRQGYGDAVFDAMADDSNSLIFDPDA